ncbi:MAG: cory-CC-star protein [Gemmatimonadota bacterium]|jgi:hypothetical protein
MALRKRESGLRRLWRALKRAAELYEGVAMAPYRAEIRRRYGRQRDAFLLATFSDALGVPSATEFYTLELLPYLMEDLHAWHLRVGLDHPPEGGWRCC